MNLFYAIFDHLESSLSLQIFAGSTSILLLGLAALIWARAIRWSFLDNMPLNRVEFDHPHLPSFRSIVFQIATFLCVATALLLVRSAFWAAPSLLIEQVGPLLVIAAIGIISELYWQRVRILGLALNLGTAFGIGLVSLYQLGTISAAVVSMLICGSVALLLSSQSQDRKLFRHWPLHAHVLLVAAAIGWILFLS